jgi:hypothetical protein
LWSACEYQSSSLPLPLPNPSKKNKRWVRDEVEEGIAGDRRRKWQNTCPLWLGSPAAAQRERWRRRRLWRTTERGNQVEERERTRLPVPVGGEVAGYPHGSAGIGLEFCLSPIITKFSPSRAKCTFLPGRGGHPDTDSDPREAGFEHQYPSIHLFPNEASVGWWLPITVRLLKAGAFMIILS